METKKYLVIDKYKDGNGDSDERVYESYQKAACEAGGYWQYLTKSEKKARTIFVALVKEEDLDEEAFEDGKIDWRLNHYCNELYNPEIAEDGITADIKCSGIIYSDVTLYGSDEHWINNRYAPYGRYVQYGKLKNGKIYKFYFDINTIEDDDDSDIKNAYNACELIGSELSDIREQYEI